MTTLSARFLKKVFRISDIWKLPKVEHFEKFKMFFNLLVISNLKLCSKISLSLNCREQHYSWFKHFKSSSRIYLKNYVIVKMQLYEFEVRIWDISSLQKFDIFLWKISKQTAKTYFYYGVIYWKYNSFMKKCQKWNIWLFRFALEYP